MRLPRGLRAFRHPDYRLFFAGQSASLIGTWMHGVAQAWLVLQLTDSAFRLGLIGTLQFLPLLLFAVVGGAVADRLPKRRLLIGTQLALAVQALLLAALVASGRVEYWHVGVLALAMGLVNTLDLPTRQSLVAEMVGPDDVASAISLNSAAFNTARVIGPAVAGLVIARYGIAPAFLVNGLSFAIVVLALVRLRGGRVARPRRGTTIFAEVAEGLRYAHATPVIRHTLTLLLVVSLCVFNFNVFVPLLARNVFGLDARGFGFLMGAVGLGAVSGALTLGAFGRRTPPRGFIVGTAALACTALAALGFVDHVGVAAAVLVVVGYTAIITMASCNTTLQVASRDEFRGRVMSLYTLVFGGTFPIGAFCVGASAERWGIGPTLVGAGALGLAGLAAVVLWARLEGPASPGTAPRGA